MCVLFSNREMLVLDEPESNLDFENQLIVLETVQKPAKEREITGIVNTHYPAYALMIADKALRLSYDRSSQFGDVTEIVNEKNMQKAFSVEVKIILGMDMIIFINKVY